jgi:hypothetical protein
MSDFYNYNYSNFNDNDEIDKLDKLAREINDKKHKDKLELIRKVDTDFKKDEKKWKKGLDDTLIKNNNFMPKKNISEDLQGNDFPYNNLYSNYDVDNKDYNTDKCTYSELLTDNTNSVSSKTFSTKSNKSNKSNKTDKLMDISTLSTDKSTIMTDTYQNSFFNSSKNSSYIDSISIDSYIDDIKNNKNNNTHYKLSKIIKNLDFDICSKKDDNIYDHVKKCSNCKKKLLYFLNNDLNNNTKIQKDNKDFFNKKNIKDAIIMIMIGIFFMILMDLVCNRKK